MDYLGIHYTGKYVPYYSAFITPWGYFQKSLCYLSAFRYFLQTKSNTSLVYVKIRRSPLKKCNCIYDIALKSIRFLRRVPWIAE